MSTVYFELYRQMLESRGCGKSLMDKHHDQNRETSVRLPCGYGCAWTNDAGEYALSGDDLITPDMARAWNPMEKITIESPGLAHPVSPVTGHG